MVPMGYSTSPWGGQHSFQELVDDAPTREEGHGVCDLLP